MPLRELVLGVPHVELEYADRVLSGDALWDAVEDRARRLVESGLCPGDRVLLHLDLTDEYVLALLAALSADLVVVPVDVSTPAVVVEEMAVRSRAAARLSASGIAACPEPTPGGVNSSGDLQYILFTSGSTGRPKGVLGSRAGLATRIRWGRDEFFAGEHRRCAVRASIAFVDSLTEILGAVAAGKRLVVAPPDARHDVGQLARFVAESGIEQVTTTPSVVPVLASSADRWSLAGVRRWIFSGEELRADWVEQVRGFSPDAEVINSYGSTEVSGDVAFHRITSSQPLPHPVPLGTIVPGVEWTIEADAGEPGAAEGGELLIGGSQVALGYVDQDAAASAFGPGRWFRTKDLVTVDDDGVLHLRGRRGHVVKVRGRRVDLDGVACSLESLPQVVEAVAWVDSSPSGMTALHAAVSVRPGAVADPSEILARLRTDVAGHLVPDRVVIVPRLPRTVTGKVDRASLSSTSPVVNRPSQDRFATGIEYVVALGIAEALGHSDFDAQTPLSDVGLDSLRSVQAAEAIRRLLGCEIDGLDLRASNKIEAIAREVLRDAGRTAGPVRVVRAADGPHVVVFLPPAIGTGLGYFPVLEEIPEGTTLALVEQDAASTAVIASAGMDALAAHYAEAIAGGFSGRTIYLVGYSFGGVLTSAVCCALGERGVEVAGIVLLDPAIPTAGIELPDDWALRRILVDAGYADHLPSEPLTVAAAHDVVRRAAGPLEFVAPSWLEQRARTLSSNNAEMVGYRPPVWSGPALVVLAGDRDRLLSDIGWVRESHPTAKFDEVDCGHFDVLRPPHAAIVAQLITSRLQRTIER